MIRESNRIVSGLIKSIRYNEVHYRTSNPYNVRWQYTFKPAYYSHINVDEPTKVNKPEDTPAARPLFFNVFRDFCVRIIPGFNLYYQRFNRITDPFQIIVLPLYALLCLNLAPLSAGYYLMAALPITIFYTRMRDRCCDPPFTEPNLRDILHQNPELGPLFKQ